MKNKFTNLWAFCVAVLLTACVDADYHLSNLDSTIQVESTVVAPLAYSRLQLTDLLTDSLKGMEILMEGDDMYLVHTDSQYMGNELMDRLEMLPVGKFDWALKIEEDIPGVSIMSGEIYKHVSFQFDEINDNPNERLDSVLFSDCDAMLTVRVVHIDLAENSYLDIQFAEDTLLLDTLRYPGNKIRIPLEQAETTVPLHLNKAMLRLKGGKEVGVLLKGEIHANSSFVAGDEIDLILDFNGVKPHLTYMNIGTARDIYQGTKTIDFNYTEDFQSTEAFFPFYDPQILMSCINNIGVPVRYYIDYVEATDSRTGQSVRADFGGENPDTTSIVVKTPAFEQIADLSINELMRFDTKQLTCKTDTLFDRAYGHTDRLFKINPDKLTYHYRIRSVDNNPNNVHFFFYNSDMTLAEQAKLPLWFEGDEANEDKNFYISVTDTVLFTASSTEMTDMDFTPNTNVVLKLSYKNFLPVGTEGHIRFLGADGNEVESMKSARQSFYIESGSVNEQGYVEESHVKEDAIRIALEYQEAKALLTEVASFELSYRIANENRKTIRLRSTDWLELKAHLYFDGSLVLNPQEMEE